MKIYADNAATTKLDSDAFEAMKPYFLDNYANPSSTYSFSKRAKQALQEARQTIAECIKAEPEHIVFTSGGTESNNHAIKCFAASNDAGCVITSSIEHHSILYACENSGSEISLLPVNKYGIVSADDLKNALKKQHSITASSEKSLVSIMTANNEIGTIQRIRELSDVAHHNGAIFHTDAVQAVGHIPIDVKAMGIDMLSASAHKFNGPKGIGFLYSNNTVMQAFHHGGTQEFGIRAGTENVPAIVGMAVALKKNVAEMKHNNEHLYHLTEAFFTALKNTNADYILNGHPTERLPGNINLSFRGRSGEGLMHMLDLNGICVSTGSACDNAEQQVSHVIQAIKVHDDYSHGTIRITLGKDNTEEDAINIANTLIRLLKV